MEIKQDKRRFDFHDIGLAIKRAREASGVTQEQLVYIVDRALRTIMYNENDGQRNGGCVRRTRGLRFLRHVAEAHETASNSGGATLRNFCWPQARKNACWGAPQTRCTSGQIVPKSRCAAP